MGSVSFCNAPADRQAEIVRFLLGAFGMRGVPPNFAPQTIAWKYFETHPWWPEGRSYVLEIPDGIAAHACVAPVRFADGARVLESMQIIDWASGRLIPGAGTLLRRYCMERRGGVTVTIGGSDDTKRWVKRVPWLTRQDDLFFYSRPLRPWRRFVLHAKDPRALARMGRNLYWKLWPVLPPPRGWRCGPADAGAAVYTHSGDFVPILRTRAWFDYLLRCPALETGMVVLSKNGTPAGHAFIAYAEGSARVADFVVAGRPAPEDRAAAFSALVRHLASRRDVLEVVAASSVPEVRDAFQACGLRPRGSREVYLADPCKLLPAGKPLEITPLIGDNFYLYVPGRALWC